MWYVVLALIGLSIITLPEVSAGKRKKRICHADRNEYYNESHKKCVDCDPCGVGKELDISMKIRKDEDGARECYGCMVCSAGTFSDSKGYKSCKVCDKCSNLNRLEAKPCTIDQQVKCGACKPGFYDYYAILSQQSDNTTDCRSCTLDSSGVPECTITATTTTTQSGNKAVVATPANSVVVNDPEQNKDAKDTENTSGGSDGTSISVIVLLAIAILGVCVTLYCFLKKGRRPDLPRCRYSPASSSVDLEMGSNSIEQPDSASNSAFAKSAEIFASPSRQTTCLLQPATASNVDEESPAESVEPDCPTLLQRENEKVTQDDVDVLMDIGNQWKDLARKLGLNDSNIEYLVMENCNTPRELVYQMLLLWQRTFCNEATVGQAHKSLTLIGKHELAARLAAVRPQPAR